MPKASQKSGKSIAEQQRRRPPSDDDDDDCYEPSQSQRGAASQAVSQARKYVNSLDQKELDVRINELVRYLLIADQKKQPIKKTDINKNVLKEFSRGFEYIMDVAKTKLNNVFGIDVVEVESKPKSYILVNALPTDQMPTFINSSEMDHANRGLLILVLSLIFMNNNEMEETVLWHALAKMGIYPDRTHDAFGDVKKLLTTEWVRQAYLQYVRRPHQDPPVFDFMWGARAKAEVSKRDVLKFVCVIHGEGVEPEHWKAQFNDIVKGEEMVVDGSADE